MLVDVVNTKLDSGNWNKAVAFWSEKYPDSKPLDNVPFSVNGMINTIAFMSIASFKEDAIAFYVIQQVERLQYHGILSRV